MTKTIERGIPLPPDIVDDLTRREFLIGAGLIALAPACGSGGESGDASGETRTIEHALGTTEVPVSPKRVVVLDPHTMLDCVVALGFEPVGIGTTPGGDGPAPWLEGEVPEDAEGVLTGDYLPNVERIATLEPDLILGWDYQEDSYEDLSEVAPTVMISSDGTFKEWVAKVGEATGTEEEAGEALARYEERAAEVREKVEGTRVSIVRPQPESLILYGPPSAPGRVMGDLGIRTQPVPEGAPGFSVNDPEEIGELSLEFIPELTGEHIFIITYDLEEGTSPEELLSGPLWQRLEAVREGRAHPVQGLAWTNRGPLGAMQMIEEVERALAGA
jgi:iron complex transport system substrate-binding protein